MNFMEAVKAMKEGKKVRRKGVKQIEQYVWYIPNKTVGLTTGFSKETKLILDDYEATDWEIVEETKTLSDEICFFNREEGTCKDWIKSPNGFKNPLMFSNEFIVTEKVKQFIKDIKEGIKEEYRSNKRIVNVEDVINKLAGKRLI